jgi:hypothetical protein
MLPFRVISSILKKNLHTPTSESMKLPIDTLAPLPLMLVFTSSAFLVLLASVFLMTVELLISTLLPQSSVAKTENWQKNLTARKFFAQEELAQETGGVEH